MVAPWHTESVPRILQKGRGCTVIEKILLLPAHPFSVGVTVMLAVILLVPALFTMKLGIFPDPLAAKPTLLLLLVQLYTVPEIAPVKLMALVDRPLQSVCEPMALTVGMGLTRTVFVQIDIQPFTRTVSVMVKLPPVVGTVPDAMVREEPVLEPEILALPEIDHEWVAIPEMLTEALKT